MLKRFLAILIMTSANAKAANLQIPPVGFDYSFQTFVDIKCDENDQIASVQLANPSETKFELLFKKFDSHTGPGLLELLNINNGPYADQATRIRFSSKEHTVDLRNSMNDSFATFGTLDAEKYLHFCENQQENAENECLKNNDPVGSDEYNRCVKIVKNKYVKYGETLSVEVEPLQGMELKLSRQDHGCGFFKNSIGAYERKLSYFFNFNGKTMGPIKTTEYYQTRSNCLNAQNNDGWK